MPGRRRLTTLLYAFPERTERCSFPTPSTPVLPFYSSPSSFFLRPPPSPPRLSLLSSLSLSFSPFYSLPFHFHTPPDVPLFPVHATLPRALSSISSTPLDCARLCCVLEERRNWKRKRVIYIYTRFSSSSSSPYSLSPLPILSYPLPSGRDYRNSAVFHSLTPFLPSLCSFFRRHRIIRAR